MKRFLRDYFSFSKKERAALIVLLILISFCFAAPYFYPVKKTVPVISSELLLFADRQRNNQALPHEKTLYSDSREMLETGSGTSAPGFEFDPNTLSAEGWKKLGLRDGLIRTILHYRMKGGRFRRPDDLAKIWGMPAKEATRLEPFIRILDTGAAIIARYSSAAPSRPIPRQIEINTAMAEEWELLPGIGKVLSKRIIAFREKLGGFSSVEQVAQTYGLPDSVFHLVKPLLVLNKTNNPGSGKVNINSASAHIFSQQLQLPAALAKAIVVYRKEYGDFTAVADLKKIPILPDSVYQRIAPLLTMAPSH